MAELVLTCRDHALIEKTRFEANGFLEVSVTFEGKVSGSGTKSFEFTGRVTGRGEKLHFEIAATDKSYAKVLDALGASVTMTVHLGNEELLSQAAIWLIKAEFSALLTNTRPVDITLAPLKAKSANLPVLYGSGASDVVDLVSTVYPGTLVDLGSSSEVNARLLAFTVTAELLPNTQVVSKFLLQPKVTGEDALVPGFDYMLRLYDGGNTVADFPLRIDPQGHADPAFEIDVGSKTPSDIKAARALFHSDPQAGKGKQPKALVFAIQKTKVEKDFGRRFPGRSREIYCDFSAVGNDIVRVDIPNFASDPTLHTEPALDEPHLSNIAWCKLNKRADQPTITHICAICGDQALVTELTKGVTCNIFRIDQHRKDDQTKREPVIGDAGATESEISVDYVNTVSFSDAPPKKLWLRITAKFNVAYARRIAIDMGAASHLTAAKLHDNPVQFLDLSAPFVPGYSNDPEEQEKLAVESGSDVFIAGKANDAHALDASSKVFETSRITLEFASASKQTSPASVVMGTDATRAEQLQQKYAADVLPSFKHDLFSGEEYVTALGNQNQSVAVQHVLKEVLRVRFLEAVSFLQKEKGNKDFQFDGTAAPGESGGWQPVQLVVAHPAHVERNTYEKIQRTLAELQSALGLVGDTNSYLASAWTLPEPVALLHYLASEYSQIDTEKDTCAVLDIGYLTADVAIRTRGDRQSVSTDAKTQGQPSENGVWYHASSSALGGFTLDRCICRALGDVLFSEGLIRRGNEAFFDLSDRKFNQLTDTMRHQKLRLLQARKRVEQAKLAFNTTYAMAMRQGSAAAGAAMFTICLSGDDNATQEEFGLLPDAVIREMKDSVTRSKGILSIDGGTLWMSVDWQKLSEQRSLTDYRKDIQAFVQGIPQDFGPNASITKRLVLGRAARFLPLKEWVKDTPGWEASIGEDDIKQDIPDFDTKRALVSGALSMAKSVSDLNREEMPQVCALFFHGDKIVQIIPLDITDGLKETITTQRPADGVTIVTCSPHVAAHIMANQTREDILDRFFATQQVDARRPIPLLSPQQVVEYAVEINLFCANAGLQDGSVTFSIDGIKNDDLRFEFTCFGTKTG